MPHSPGPWDVDPAGSVWDANGNIVVDPPWRAAGDDEATARWEANRLLFLAAPETLAALRKVTERLRERIEDNRERSPENVEKVCKDDGVLEAEAVLKRIDGKEG